MKKVYKIVLTGGPRSGNSIAIKVLREHFTQRGYRVLVVTKAVTELMNGGISSYNMDSTMFQYLVASAMRYKEKLIEQAAEAFEEERILIIYDRGQMDNAAYMSNAQLREIMIKLNTNRVEMRDGYDAVFHLETAAKATDRAYSDSYAERKIRRDEDPMEAARIDFNTIRSWTGHPHLRIIPAYGDFKDKIKALIEQVESVAGEGESLEIERRFLVKRPDDETIKSIPLHRVIDIEQCYIKVRDGQNGTARIRRRGEGGHYIYIYTEKSCITEITRNEQERRITKSEYDEYKESAFAVLEKKRVCICDGGKYFELDIYPYSDKYALCEIELLTETERFSLPSELKVIREVTGEERFSNKSIAITHKIEI